MTTQSSCSYNVYRALTRIPRTLLAFALGSSMLMVAGNSIAEASSSRNIKQPSFADNWLGGTDNWSNAAQWSAGLPSGSSDVLIYSGGSDTVYLNVNAAINSLTLGGTTGSSMLTANGNGSEALNIATALTVNPTGSVQLLQNQTVNAATLSNGGMVYVGYNAALNLTGQPDGITDIVQGSYIYLLGSFEAGNHSALAKLTNVEGSLVLDQLENIPATPTTGTLTVSSNGMVNITNNAVLQITGDLSNSGAFTVQSGGSGGYALAVSGTFTNQPGTTFTVQGGKASFGSLSNQGTIINWGTINLSNQPNGITDVVAGSEFRNYGSVMAGANDGFGQLQSIEGRLLIENGRANSITPTNGALNVASPGYFEINWGFRPGTGLQVNGDLNNAGWVNNEGALVTVTGTLTNNNRLDVFGNGLPAQNQLVVMGSLVNTGHITVDYDPTVTTPFLINAGRIDVDKQSGLIVGSGASGLGYIQYADGTLEDVISGLNLTGDIFLEGGPTLDGTLNVMLENGFIPQVGSVFEFMHFKPGSLVGQFAQIDNQYFNNETEEWIVDYDNADGYLELQVVAAQPTPEPASLVMLGTGLVSVVTFLRSRCKA